MAISLDSTVHISVFYNLQCGEKKMRFHPEVHFSTFFSSLHEQVYHYLGPKSGILVSEL